MLVPEKFKDHIQISDSRRKNFVSCARYFYWSYIRELTTPRGAVALRYGKVWHSVLEAYYGHVIKYGWEKKDPLGKSALEAGIIALGESWNKETGELEFPEDYRTKEALAESFLLYINEFNMEKHTLEILSTEFKFMVPDEVVNEDCLKFPYLVGKKILFTGIVDMIAKEYGHIWAYEHKSTGMWVQSIQKTFRRSAQTQGYLRNIKECPEHKEFLVEGIMINLHHLSAGKLKAGGFGKKKIEFLRDPQIYSESDFREWRNSTLAVLNDIERCKETDFYPMNLDSCHAYNKPCPFTPLCEQNKKNLKDTITDAYVHRERDV